MWRASSCDGTLLRAVAFVHEASGPSRSSPLSPAQRLARRAGDCEHLFVVEAERRRRDVLLEVSRGCRARDRQDGGRAR
jgi:hypothetical protein